LKFNRRVSLVPVPLIACTDTKIDRQVAKTVA
jgi:hypothetical protein